MLFQVCVCGGGGGGGDGRFFSGGRGRILNYFDPPPPLNTCRCSICFSASRGRPLVDHFSVSSQYAANKNFKFNVLCVLFFHSTFAHKVIFKGVILIVKRVKSILVLISNQILVKFLNIESTFE